MTVLVVEANDHLRSLIAWNLGQLGWDCEGVSSLRAAREWLQQGRAQLVILDADLSDGGGLEFCGWLREQSPIPILLLSARNREPDVVSGLDAGADDYLVKPFGLQEFQARVRALLRRQGNGSTSGSLLQLRDLMVDPVQRRITRGNQTVDLTPQEFSLLYVLIQAGGDTLTRAELLERAWPDRVDNPRTVDTHVLSLRKKLETDPQAPQLIVTVRAVGYRLNTD